MANITELILNHVFVFASIEIVLWHDLALERDLFARIHEHHNEIEQHVSDHDNAGYDVEDIDPRRGERRAQRGERGQRKVDDHDPREDLSFVWRP